MLSARVGLAMAAIGLVFSPPTQARRLNLNHKVGRYVESMKHRVRLPNSRPLRLEVGAQVKPYGKVKVSIPASRIFGTSNIPGYLKRQIRDVVVPGVRDGSGKIRTGRFPAKLSGRGRNAKLTFTVDNAHLSFWLNSRTSTRPSVMLRFRNGMAGQFQLESRQVVVDWTGHRKAQAQGSKQRYAGYRQSTLNELNAVLAKQDVARRNGNTAEVQRLDPHVKAWQGQVRGWEQRIQREQSRIDQLNRRPETTTYVEKPGGGYRPLGR